MSDKDDSKTPKRQSEAHQYPTLPVYEYRVPRTERSDENFTADESKRKSISLETVSLNNFRA